MKLTDMNLKNPPKKYRPLPFWSWNSRLSVDETLFQIDEMDKAGMGGYFMHARGGLKTEYMGEEWMDNVRAAVKEGEKRGMAAWGYDENGWPSGFGSGAVNGLGVKYQQKYLHMEITDEEKHTDTTVHNLKGEDGRNMHFYYSLNRFYIDALDPEVTDAFILSTHEKYKNTLGKDFKSMAGFFTDEPQLSRKEKAFSWSFVLPGEYEKEYGQELLPRLDRLFVEREDSFEVRFKFWRLVTKIFSENFMKRIYDWCNENGTRLTGHMVLEESYSVQLDTNGACMPNYMYMHIPGVDKLGRSVFRDLLAPQVTSVCAQTGKKQVLTESFALCGWDVSFEDLKWILEWQMVKGVNLLCQHLSGYSLAGLRKRDYPAGHAYQNFWWDQYRLFNDFVSRVGMLLCEGKIKCDTLVLHTISSGWLCRCDDHNWQEEIDKKYSDTLTDVITTLDKSQVIHHLGDEIIMEKIASVSGGKLKIGQMEYSTVIVPPCLNLFSNTRRLLKEFSDQGGNLIFIGEIPGYIDGEKTYEVKTLAKKICTMENLVASLPESAFEISLSHFDGTACDLQYAQRGFDDFTMHYFVNTYSEKEEAELTLRGESLARFDYMTGEVVPYPCKKEGGMLKARVCLEEKGSLVLFSFPEEKYPAFSREERKLTPLTDKLKGVWSIKKMDQNALNLDYCTLSIDGEKIADNFHVTDIEELANSYEKKINVCMEFVIKSETDVEGDAFLVMEEPQYYDIFINGEKIEKIPRGYYRDKAFIKLDISGKIKRGDNNLKVVTDFVQPQHIYETIRDCYEFESMKNKLWYDREIEEIYLLGDFFVKSRAPFVDSPNDSTTTKGEFYLVAKEDEITHGDFVCQGLPFHCGSITLSKKIFLDKTETKERSLEFSRMGSVITKLWVNGKEFPPLVWAPYTFDLSDCLMEGENEIEIELISNFRNLLGPLHNGDESYRVAPGSFYKDSKIFGVWAGNRWSDEYTFLKKGLFF